AFLKWRRTGSLLEPELAAILSKQGGAYVPETLAFDRATGRWLTAGIQGRPLADDLSVKNVRRSAAMLAHVQLNLLCAGRTLRAIGVPAESLADLVAEADRIFEWLPSLPARPDVQKAKDRVRLACADLDGLHFSDVWIHTDFVPENIILDDREGCVYFIDFDEPWIGPAPVTLEFFAAWLRRHVAEAAKRSVLASNAREVFSQVWRAHHSLELLQKAFASTRLVAEVLRVSRRIRAIAAREASHELRGFLEPAARQSADRLVALAN